MMIDGREAWEAKSLQSENRTVAGLHNGKDVTIRGKSTWDENDPLFWQGTASKNKNTRRSEDHGIVAMHGATRHKFDGRH